MWPRSASSSWTRSTVSLIKTHCDAEDEIDDENIAPKSNGDTFAIGVMTKTVTRSCCVQETRATYLEANLKWLR